MSKKTLCKSVLEGAAWIKNTFTSYSVIFLLSLTLYSSSIHLIIQDWHSFSRIPDEEHRGYDKTYQKLL